jgi:hypothetical protein
MRGDRPMKKLAVFLLIAVFVVSSCAPSAPTLERVDVATSTATLAPSATLAPTETSTPEPTATLTPEEQAINAMPPELQEFVKAGGSYDLDKGTAYLEDGKVSWIRSPDGTWTENATPGVYEFHLTDGTTYEMPIYADIDSALEIVVNDVDWGDYFAFTGDRITTQDELRKIAIRKMKYIDKFGTSGGPSVLREQNDPEKFVPINLWNLYLDDGTEVRVLTWRSVNDKNKHDVIIFVTDDLWLEILESGEVRVDMS